MVMQDEVYKIIEVVGNSGESHDGAISQCDR
jgi:flavin-binding protein dodecin